MKDKVTYKLFIRNVCVYFGSSLLFKHVLNKDTFCLYYFIKILSSFLIRRSPLCNGYRHMKIDTATQVQILADANCISHSTNTLGKGMNPIILPPAMGK